jgi:hypothetical protein
MSKLDDHGAAIKDQIDAVPDGAEGGESAHLTLERSQSQQAAPAAPPPQETPPEKPETPSAPPAAKEQPVEAAPVAPESPSVPSSPAPATPALDLSGYSEAQLNALRKFAPGGKIETEEQLKQATDRAWDDYWRIQGRLADLAKAPETKPEEKPAPAPPPPPELQRLDNQLQTVESATTNAQTQRDGWNLAKQNAYAKVQELRDRRAQGTLADDNELLQAQEVFAKADDQISRWDRELYRLAGVKDDLDARRSEVDRIIKVQERLDRQEREGQEKETNEQTEAFKKLWNDTLIAVMTERAVDEEHKAALTEVAAVRTNFAVQAQAIKDASALRDLLVNVVDGYMKPIKDAAAKAVQNYITEKARDNPPPVQAAKPNGSAPASSKPGSLTSMKDLQRVVDTADWG